jgi:hypothetical protein
LAESEISAVLAQPGREPFQASVLRDGFKADFEPRIHRYLLAGLGPHPAADAAGSPLRRPDAL